MTALSFHVRKFLSTSSRRRTATVAERPSFSESLGSQTPVGMLSPLRYYAMLPNMMSKRLKILLLESDILWRAKWVLPMAERQAFVRSGLS